MDNSIFKNLFILDMANSHEGSVEHGLAIIDAAAAVVKKHGIRATVKFQYRDFDTLIHPDYRERQDVKHIPRFLANRLPWDAFARMNERVRELGMVTMATPSDEPSVDKCVEHDMDIVKVPSPAALDWPLLRKIAAAGKPVIISTGGLKLLEIDEVVDFFTSRGITFALEHCVSAYPMRNEQANMHFLRRLIRRYPNVVVGWSGHESPDNLDVGKAAIGAGAQMLERHIGIPTPEKELNAYSMNPEQLDTWVCEMVKVQQIMGSEGDKVKLEEEREALQSLARGVWAREPIKTGEKIAEHAVFYAMPLQPEQLTSGELGRSGVEFVASRDYAAGEPIVEAPERLDAVRDILQRVKEILREAQITTGTNVEIELSHHYGLEKYTETGAAIVNILNREYCKKLLVLLPGQQHPEHMHKVKEEAFHVLWGDIQLTRDGEIIDLSAGEIAIVERGQWHNFSTRDGVVFEEISTTHVKGDSYYKDSAVAQMDVAQRKTVVGSW
ncbi:MAG: sialic acid synthase [Candidatus Andersenbacteria bacterium CG10_big_fil_rev_8_21_14_0_10_54_11]|uniref:Sialic acid synthase n=1 Tax=Candidatus Andersenbacteria bacterium CG10_big_fil_rev_8_21_14_0_10_54_11 TaxID=1974485 RepID=A0A2M6X0A3_9BACT|nr:MAG: sialic acid synthase [Candidatus Andersenbacteria bacterium CG10_big_fil_rev_8_21_14_0_10_54_11]